MGKAFGKGNYPTVWTGRVQTNQRERLFFVAAAGLCFSLFLILIFVLNFRSSANASSDNRPQEVLQSASPATVTLLTPARTVKAVEALSGVQFKELYWPRNQVPDGAIHNVSEVQGMYAKNEISPQVPLTRASLTKEQEQEVLPVTAGNRAVTIDVDGTTGIEGWTVAGTRVDVVLTYYQADSLASKIIVQNARVISYNGNTSTLNELNKNMPGMRKAGGTVTLDVAVKDALEIQTSKQLGKLSLMMRNPDDNNGAQVTQINGLTVTGGTSSADAHKPNCRMGHMFSNGKNYVVGCDGTLTEVSNPAEP